MNDWVESNEQEIEGKRILGYEREIKEFGKWREKETKCLFGYRLLLKTENWKYCSKIIFKCVNSTMEPVFNEKVAEKCSLWDL